MNLNKKIKEAGAKAAEAIPVMAFDPGKATGACVAMVDTKEWLSVGASTRTLVAEGGVDEVGVIIQALMMFDPKIVICEDFKPRQGPGMVMISAELIGAIRAWCFANKAEFVRQSPSAIQGEDLDVVMRAGASVHEAEAVMHLQVFLKKKRKVLEAAKPLTSKLILPKATLH